MRSSPSLAIPRRTRPIVSPHFHISRYLDDRAKLDEIFKREAIDGVFSVQDHFVEDEVAQGASGVVHTQSETLPLSSERLFPDVRSGITGKTLADLAKKYNVKRFVYNASVHAGVEPHPVPKYVVLDLGFAIMHKSADK